jgi:hypothetical protein
VKAGGKTAALQNAALRSDGAERGPYTAKGGRCASGEKHGSEAVVKAIDGKIFAIYREDFADALSLGGSDQGRISHVHGAIGILAH